MQDTFSSEAERTWYEDIAGRGAGDPDRRDSPVNKQRYATPAVYAHKPYFVYVAEPKLHWTKVQAMIERGEHQPKTRREYETAENDPAAPENNWDKE